MHTSALLTPVSNTGSKCQNSQSSLNSPPSLEAKIHWFQGAADFPNLERVHELFEFLRSLKDIWLPLPGQPFYCGKLWENSAQSAAGGKAGYSPQSDGTYRVFLSLPGSLFDRVSLKDGWRVLLGLSGRYRFTCTRIDLKIRDFKRRIMPAECLALAIAGDVALVKKWSVSGSGEIGCSGSVGGDRPGMGITRAGDFTCYLGSFKSEKMLRIYDALPVHGIDAIDFECQFRDEKANEVFRYLGELYTGSLENPTTHDEISQLIGALVAGAADFVKRLPGLRLSRCERYSWWQDILDEIGGSMRVSIPKIAPTLERVEIWLHKQVFPSLAVFRDLYGREIFKNFMNSSLSEAKKRWGLRHELLLESGKLDVVFSS